jgi:hypothetical protein
LVSRASCTCICRDRRCSSSAEIYESINWSTSSRTWLHCSCKILQNFQILSKFDEYQHS